MVMISMARNSPYASGGRRSAVGQSPYGKPVRDRKTLGDDYGPNLGAQAFSKNPMPNDIKRLTITKPKRNLYEITGRNPPELPQMDKKLLTDGLRSNSLTTSNENDKCLNNGSISQPIEMTQVSTKPQAQPGPLFEINQTAVEEGYWMAPSVSDLRMYSREKLAALPSFVVGRKGYGQIEYLKPVDLTGLTSIGDVLGNVVVFGHGGVMVYPDEATKPREVGEGLNQPAVVTIENIYPKGTKGKVIEPSDRQLSVFVTKLRQKIEKKGGEHVSYDYTSGNWVFKVPHFSYWGINSDDEDMLVDDEEVTGLIDAVPIEDEDDLEIHQGQDHHNDLITFNVDIPVGPQKESNPNYIDFDEDDESLLDMSNIVQPSGREKSIEPPAPPKLLDT
jgi:hypothetical protein